MEIVNGNANPSPDDPVLTEVLRLATLDAQAALRIVHENAKGWNIDSDRIGIMGTSAGGGVGFAALVADAPADEKPDFLISVYGPSLVDLSPAPEGAPPLFMVTEADHGPVTDGLIAAFSIWKAASRKAELHIYEVPNFTMTVGLWGRRLFDWMEEQGILPAAD
jgi:dienelactone hydrolase